MQITVREHLPARISAQDVALPAQDDNMVTRGLAALHANREAFDEEIYRKARPQFLEVARPFMHPGITYKDFVRLFFRAMIERFGNGVKPYAIRFTKECEPQFKQRERKQKRASRASAQPVDRNSQDERYRQARAVFDRETAFGNWRAGENPAIASAIDVFRQLADEHYEKAYYPLSVLCCGGQDDETRGAGTQHLAQLAFEWCLAKQAEEDAELWCDLGDMYKNGHGVAQDPIQAQSWYRKAAERGDARGQWALGLCLYDCDSGDSRENALAFEWMSQAAGQGDAFLQSWLGDFYEMDARHEAAVYWYSQAAAQGDKDGQYKLGVMYEEGRGVAQDDRQAAVWYRKAAEQGHAEAQWQLGQMHEYDGY